MNRLFRLGLAQCMINNFKASAARHYEQTRQKIMAAMVKGYLIHADETRIVLKGKPAYVWVFATFREVIYFYSETRESDLLETLLKDFQGVLVSDFYAAYDSIPCPQQKCLIHLMRDLNDDLLKSPFDEELKEMTREFTMLLKPMIETIDRFGLKEHFLKDHKVFVDCFYTQIDS